MVDRRKEESDVGSTLSASLQARGFYSAAGIVCPFFQRASARDSSRGR